MPPTARFVALFLALHGLVQAALLSVPPASGGTRPNGYIVSLKPEAAAVGLLDALNLTSSVLYAWPALHAFAGVFGDAALLALRAADAVRAIEHDTRGALDARAVQTDAPWGLQRISQAARMPHPAADDSALDYTYTYDDAAGRGVDIYVIDTGIMIEHEDFGGRARWGKTFGGYADRDGFGHGTHVAGSAAGTQYGVAKAANLVAVRVMDDNGGGYASDTIAAVDWAVKQATRVTRRPSVINLSLRFAPSDVLDAAVAAAVRAGVHVTVSAGNAGADAATQSPARAPAALCVGATQLNDSVAPFSNYGPLVDVFAPGQHVVSAYINGTDSRAVMSGTSMAAPHVAGLVAYLISLEGNKSPRDVQRRIQQLGSRGLVAGLPARTANELINNGFRG